MAGWKDDAEAIRQLLNSGALRGQALCYAPTVLDCAGHTDEREHRTRVGEVALDRHRRCIEPIVCLHCQLDDAGHADPHEVRSLLIGLRRLGSEVHTFEIEVELVDGDPHQQPETVGRDFGRESSLLLIEAFVEFSQAVSHLTLIPLCALQSREPAGDLWAPLCVRKGVLLSRVKH